MVAQTNTNPASAVNIDPAQQIKAKITMPNDPPMGIPGQWGFQPLQNPIPGMGTSQYQSALNPRIAPNLSEYPLGVDPMMWSTYMGNNPYADYSWNNKMAGIVQPADVNSWIMQYLSPQQQAQVTPDQIAALQNGGSTAQPMMGRQGGLGGLGGYSSNFYNQPVASANVNMGSANPINVAMMSAPVGMPSQYPSGQYDAGTGSQMPGQPYYGPPATPYNGSQFSSPNGTLQKIAAASGQPETPGNGFPAGADVQGVNGLSYMQGPNASPDLGSQISTLYQSFLGKQPNKDVLDYFTKQIGNGDATLNDLQQTLGAFKRDNGTLSNQFFPNSQDAIWMNAMDQGRQAVAGINRMPFTFSNYAGVPSDPSAAFNEFYPKTTLTDYQAQLLGMEPGGANGGANSQYYFPKAVADYKNYLQNASSPPKDIDAALKAYDNALFTKVSNGPGYDASGMPWGTANNTDNQTMQNAWGAYMPQSYS